MDQQPNPIKSAEIGSPSGLIKKDQLNWQYLIIVALAAIFIGGGILAYQYWWVPDHQTEPPNVQLPDRSETADWKVYQNEEYRFEVRYPRDWFIADGEFEDFLYNFQLVFARDEEDLKVALHEGKLIPLTHRWHELSVSIGEKSLAEKGVDILSSPQREECQVVSFLSITVLRCLHKGVNEIGDRLGPTILFDYKGKKWNISWPTISEDTYDYDPIYDKILFTFRFIE